jgi:DNA-binding GntR family transcriptional regulator
LARKTSEPFYLDFRQDDIHDLIRYIPSGITHPDWRTEQKMKVLEQSEQPDRSSTAKKTDVPAALSWRAPVVGMDWKISQTNVREQVVQKLRLAILSGVLRPGEKLTDGRLCRELNVSRTSIREALRYLEAEKLITISSSRVVVSKLDRTQAKRIYQLLGLLLSEAAKAIAIDGSSQHHGNIRLMQIELKTLLETEFVPVAFATATRCYTLILEASENPLMMEISRNLLLRCSYLSRKSLTSEARARASILELLQILQAIQKKDPLKVSNAMLLHFGTEAQEVCNILDELQSETR